MTKWLASVQERCLPPRTGPASPWLHVKEMGWTHTHTHLVTVVPAAFKSLRNTSYVVLSWSTTFLMVILTPWGNILHGARDQRYLVAILHFFHFRIISCHLLTKLHVDGLVAHSSFVQVYSLVPDVLWQLISLARGGREVRMKETDFLDRWAHSQGGNKHLKVTGDLSQTTEL